MKPKSINTLLHTFDEEFYDRAKKLLRQQPAVVVFDKFQNSFECAVYDLRREQMEEKK